MIPETSIKTYSGKWFDFLNPDPRSIVIEDIAHALSMICRFTGQSSVFYSVSQHSVLVSRLVPKGFEICGLLHDASEAYMGDLVKPLKGIIPRYREIEEVVMRAVAKSFGLDYPFPPEVKKADILALAMEGKRFMHGREDEFGELPEGAEPLRESSWSPVEAGIMFLRRYRELEPRK